MSSLIRDITELGINLEQQSRSVQNSLELLESVDQRLAQAWNEQKSYESDYLQLVTGIFRVIDNYQIGTANLSNPSYVLGVLESLLRNQSIEPIRVSAGDPFEPRLHHCEETVQDPQQAPGTVVEVLEAGYVRSLSDGIQSVIRPARVTVTADHDDVKRGKDES